MLSHKLQTLIYLWNNFEGIFRGMINVLSLMFFPSTTATTCSHQWASQQNHSTVTGGAMLVKCIELSSV